jgi:hypothetical protein
MARASKRDRTTTDRASVSSVSHPRFRILSSASPHPDSDERDDRNERLGRAGREDEMETSRELRTVGMMTRRAAGALVALLMTAAGCRAEAPQPDQAVSPQGNAAAFVEGEPYRPQVDPSDFVETIDNPYFPLTPGTTLVYRGVSNGEREVVRVTVTDETKEILGITTTVVRDRVFVDGKLAEDTFDWYAQDGQGNVWYLGEDTKEYEDGKVVTTEGSWEAGVDGAQPGVIMPAGQDVGITYRQEFYEGEAEDLAKVVALGETVKVPAGSFDEVLVTEDWTPLDPKLLERKYYAPGVGVVFERLIKGGDEVLRLVEIRR